MNNILRNMTASQARWLLLVLWVLYVVSWRGWVASSRHPEVMMTYFQITLIPTIIVSVVYLWALKGRRGC